MPKPKLAFVINTLQKGGAERVLSTIVNNLKNRQFDIIVICINEAEQCYNLSSGIKVIHLLKRKNNENIFWRIVYGFLTFTRMIRVFHKEKPELAISFMTSANIWTGLTCSLIQLPYIVSERITPNLSINKLNFVSKGLSYLLYKNAKAIVSPAKGIEDCLKTISIFKNLKNYKVINNPINTFKSTNKTNVHPEKFILAVGRLTRQKGFDLLIEAFSKVKHDIHLLIVGEGEERLNLTKIIARYNLQEKVHLVGLKDDIVKYYAQAELFVLSSRNEGYPNVLIEAMSTGCACVAMDCEFGPSEIIKNRINGVLIEKDNLHMLSLTIDEILSNPTFKKYLAQNAKLVSQTNSLDTISDQWQSLILSHTNN